MRIGGQKTIQQMLSTSTIPNTIIIKIQLSHRHTPTGNNDKTHDNRFHPRRAWSKLLRLTIYSVPTVRHQLPQRTSNIQVSRETSTKHQLQQHSSKNSNKSILCIAYEGLFYKLCIASEFKTPII